MHSVHCRSHNKQCSQCSDDNIKIYTNQELSVSPSVHCSRKLQTFQYFTLYYFADLLLYRKKKEFVVLKNYHYILTLSTLFYMLTHGYTSVPRSEYSTQHGRHQCLRLPPLAWNLATPLVHRFIKRPVPRTRLGKETPDAGSALDGGS